MNIMDNKIMEKEFVDKIYLWKKILDRKKYR